MVYYEIIESQQELDGRDREVYYCKSWRLKDALLLASEWVSWEGLSGARRTARVVMWPDVDESDDPECAMREVAFMTWEA